MPATTIRQHAVGLTLQVDVPEDVSTEGAKVTGRLQKPDNSVIIVPVEAKLAAVLFVTRQGDLDHVGTYYLRATVEKDGKRVDLSPASFAVISQIQAGTPTPGAYY